jgi:hypothetical protein
MFCLYLHKKNPLGISQGVDMDSVDMVIMSIVDDSSRYVIRRGIFHL